jgi:hypothetical protein
MTVEPEPHAAPEPEAGASTVDVCPLCGARVAAGDLRCPACNMTLAGVGPRPAPFTSRSLWWWAAGLLVIYLIVLAIVAAAR